MPTRFFGFNTLAGAKRSATTVVDGDTTASRFDSSYVSNCIKVAQGEYLQVMNPFADGSASLTGTIYVRFDSYQVNGAAAGPLVFLLNAGANAYRVIGAGTTTAKVQYWNSGTAAWVDWGSSFTYNNAVNTVYMLKLAINSAFELYQAGSLVASSSTVPTNGAAAVTEFRFASTNSTNAAFFSQLMCADYDIRDSHLFSKLPTANGTYTDGTGAATDVGEAVLDDGTAIGLPAVGNKHTFTKAATPSLPSGLTIAALGVNIRGRVGGGTVTDGKAKIRSNVTDAASGSKAFTAGYEPRGHFFTTDPDTASAWTKTALDAAEIGMEAA